MNTNPAAKTILCFGDSNTFGQRSDQISKGRWPADIRWTGQLQQLLGSDYYVIEEGLSSRTTDLEYQTKPGRNGKTYLLPCLQSHNPLDMVIIMLGTNDVKDEFNRGVDAIAQALSGLIDDVRQYATNIGHQTKILLISPIHISDTAPNFTELYTGKYSLDSVAKASALAAASRAIATAQDCAFFDAATVAQPGQDGIHFSKDSHRNFAENLAPHIENLLHTVSQE